jgi:hypothetical protein
MSTNLKELGEFIQLASSAGVSKFCIEGEKITVEFSASLPVINPPIPEEQSGSIEVVPDLAERIEEIRRQEEELNKMIENPEEYEEMLARVEEHELEDMPANGEGES